MLKLDLVKLNTRYLPFPPQILPRKDGMPAALLKVLYRQFWPKNTNHSQMNLSELHVDGFCVVVKPKNQKTLFN